VLGVLETWRSLFEQGFVVEHPELMNDLSAINALIRSDNGRLSGEEAAMALVDSYTINQIPPELRAEFDFFRFPIIDPAIPLAETIDVVGYVAPAGSGHEQQVQHFLTYLGSPGSQALIAQELARINAVFAPVRADLDAEVITVDAGKAIRMLQESADVVPFTYQAMPSEMWTAFSSAYRQLLGDRQDIYGFVDTLERTRQDNRADGIVE
jgi:ABC-type glycerol-3-phosphate transport system substrate-binding protein